MTTSMPVIFGTYWLRPILPSLSLPNRRHLKLSMTSGRWSGKNQQRLLFAYFMSLTMSIGPKIERNPSKLTLI